jgi:hypothetical protein
MADIDIFNLSDEEIKRLEIFMEESLNNPENSIDEELITEGNGESDENGNIQIFEQELSSIKKLKESLNKSFIVNKPSIPAPSKNYELIDLDKIDKALDNIINKKSELNADTLLIKFKKCSNIDRHRELVNVLGDYYYFRTHSVYISDRKKIITPSDNTFTINFKLDEFEEFNQSQINNLVTDKYCLYRASDNALFIPTENTSLADKIHLLNSNRYVNYIMYRAYNGYYYSNGITNNLYVESSFIVSDISTYNIKTLKDVESTQELINRKESVESVLNNLFDEWYYIKSSILDKNLFNNLTRQGNEYITYLIRFPEIRIKNSREQEHIIKNFYVCLTFDLHFRLIGKIRGFKTTYSAVEILNSYVHSHLTVRRPKGIVENYQCRTEFCLGIGQPIELSIVKLNNLYDEEILTSLCVQLESYLSWESLEGNPYVKIEGLVKRNNYIPYRHSKLGIGNQTPKQKQIFELIKNKCFEYYVNDNKIKIKNIVKNTISANFINNAFTKIYVNNNQYYTKTNNSSSDDIENHSYVLNYRNRLHETLEVINNKHKPTKLINTYINEENDREYEQVENLFEIKDFLEYVEYLIN